MNLSLRPTASPQDGGEQSKSAFLDGQDSYMKWGNFVVSMFHSQHIIHLMPVATKSPDGVLIYYPHRVDEAKELEALYWKHKVDDATTAAMKFNGAKQTPLYEPINYTPPAPDPADGKIYAEDGTTELTAAKLKTLKSTWDKDQKELQAANELERNKYKAILDKTRTDAEKYLIGEAKGKVFSKIQASIHEDYESAIQQVSYGDAPGLLLQIDLFMQSDRGGRQKALLQCFMNSTFEVEGKNDLQKWINFLATTRKDLTTLKEAPSEQMLKTKFLESLPEKIFDVFSVALFNKTLNYQETVDLAKDYANHPSIAKQLADLSSLHSKGSHTRSVQGLFALEGTPGGKPTTSKHQWSHVATSSEGHVPEVLHAALAMRLPSLQQSASTAPRTIHQTLVGPSSLLFSLQAGAVTQDKEIGLPPPSKQSWQLAGSTEQTSLLS
jgi:hypothetical protein